MATVSAESESPRLGADVEKWIVEYRQGDEEALGRLLDMCRHYLLLVAGKDLAPALQAKIAPSDIVQDTLMSAARVFPRFVGDSEEELLAWLRGILRNKVTDVYRQFSTEKRQATREIPWAEVTQVDVLRDPMESPSRQAQARERDEQLEKAMQQLPEHYRQVLRMYSMDRLTFVQIAEKMDSTADAVRKLWGRAAEELAKHLASLEESS